MPSTTALEEIKSKWACPACKQNKIINTCETDHFNTHGYRLHYRCANCSYEFSENEKQEKRREKKGKKEGDQPWASGSMVSIAMLVVIMLILSVRNDQREPSESIPPQASSQLLNRTE